MSKVGRPPKESELKRNYVNHTYVRLAIYPHTRNYIREMAKQENMSMVDWIDIKVRKP